MSFKVEQLNISDLEARLNELDVEGGPQYDVLSLTIDPSTERAVLITKERPEAPVMSLSDFFYPGEDEDEYTGPDGVPYGDEQAEAEASATINDGADEDYVEDRGPEA